MRNTLIEFFKYFRENGEKYIGMSIEQFVDIFLKNNQIKMYLVLVKEGIHDDICTNDIFVTESKEFAENWVNRFNKIISDNRNRIVNNYENKRFLETMWSDSIYYENVRATFKEINLR